MIKNFDLYLVLNEQKKVADLMRANFPSYIRVRLSHNVFFLEFTSSQPPIPSKLTVIERCRLLLDVFLKRGV